MDRLTPPSKPGTAGKGGLGAGDGAGLLSGFVFYLQRITFSRCAAFNPSAPIVLLLLLACVVVPGVMCGGGTLGTPRCSASVHGEGSTTTWSAWLL